MKTLYKSVLIIDPLSPFHGKKRDVITDGVRILEIGISLQLTKGKTIDTKQLVLSQGWIDSYAHFRDPGEEAFEDIRSGMEAALAGGFKRVVLSPATSPAIDHKSGVERILNLSNSSAVKLLPLGALSAGLEGEQLAEHYDMHKAGAIAFTDDKHSVNSGLMLRALEYVKSFNGLVVGFPFDSSISPLGQIHEGQVSVQTGLRGIPELAEELRLMRDIELLRYTESRLHVAMISTARSVEIIKKAKKDGLRITCGVAAHHLSYTDSNCMSYESNFKVMPPLRTRTHQKALIQGLKDGTIDVICSDHRPWDSEHKVLEFEYASEGIAGIQTTFQQAYQALREHLEISDIIQFFTTNPAAIFGIELSALKEGHDHGHTIVGLSEYTSFAASNWASKSIYHPLYGEQLLGKIHA